MYSVDCGLGLRRRVSLISRRGSSTALQLPALPLLLFELPRDVGVNLAVARCFYGLLASEKRQIYFVNMGHSFEDGGESLDFVLNLIKGWSPTRTKTSL